MVARKRPISIPHSAEEDLVFLLSRLGAVTRSSLADRLSSFGLTPRQFVVLKTLARHDGIAQTELSGRLGIDTSSIVHVVDECEKGGLAERRRREDDRRRYALSLTARGRRTVEAAQRSVDELSEELLAALTGTDRTSLHNLLLQVAAAHSPAGREEVSVGS